MTLVASVIKYGVLFLRNSPPPQWVPGSHVAVFVIATIGGFLSGSYFFWALNVAHTGIRVLNEMLWQGFARHKDWDKLT